MSDIGLVQLGDEIERVIAEIDGPPRAYFEFRQEALLIRCIYRTIGYWGTHRDKVEPVFEGALDALRAMLLDTLRAAHSDLGLIVWRKRSQVIHDTTAHRFKMRARVATIPDLTSAQWKLLGAIYEDEQLQEVV